MHDTLRFLEQHAYWLIVCAIFARQACLPMPANLFLIAAGALARSGQIRLSESVGLSVVTFLFADFLWYLAGHRFGDRILHFGCGLSTDPVSCLDKATGSFARHGPQVLLVSKFVIGLDAVAAPLAGAANIPITHFLFYDAMGALLWTSAYALLGYIFSEQLDIIATHVARIGIVLALAGAAWVGFYVARRVGRWQAFRKQFKLSRVTNGQVDTRN